MAKVFGASALGFFLLLVICNFSNCVTTELDETEHYDVYSELAHLGTLSAIHKLREKRQTSTDLKNQYQSVSQNSTEAIGAIPPSQPNSPQQDLTKGTAAAAAAASKDAVGTERNSTPAPVTSVVVPFTASDRPLLGVNGTGQRIDPTNLTAIQPTPNGAPNKYPKKVYTSNAGVGGGNMQQQEVGPEQELTIDNVDVPENETISELQNKNYTVNQTTIYHDFYNSTIYVSKLETDSIWESLKNISPNSMLSKSHRRAMTVELTFDFPFYGHPVRNITVATGGFLYTGEYVHSWLAATQYIAPLMANFDTSLGDDSYVRFNDNGTAFTVIWENVYLQEKEVVGKFSFSTTLHKNGDIVFVYYSVPVVITSIQDDKHPVKVGLSDAYIIDKMVYVARRKTIYEYHRVNFANSDIKNSTIIYLKALPTCLDYKDCGSCINHMTAFDCAWCPSLNRCSTGTDRRKQEWLQKGCDKTQIDVLSACPAPGQKGNNSNQTRTEIVPPPTNNNKSNDNHDNITHQEDNSHNENVNATISPTNVESLNNVNKAAAIDNNPPPKNVGLAFGVLAPICLVVTVLLWLLYAYRNPHTKSGQLLIQFRPSQWSWRRGEARYTAATIHM